MTAHWEDNCPWRIRLSCNFVPWSGTEVHLAKAADFSMTMYEYESCTVKESWEPKNWCFWSVVLEKTLESPLVSKEIQPTYPKGNQSWIFTGRTDAKAEAPIHRPPDVKNWLIEKTLMLGNIKGKRRRGQQRMRWLDSFTDSVDLNLSKLWEIAWTGEPGVLHSKGSQRVKHHLATEQQQLRTAVESKFAVL